MAFDKRILVAEDNPINQRLVSSLLSRLGYRAEIAQNGADALRLLAVNHFDAVLMDVHMPVMDGIEATRAIRRLNGSAAQIPIIAVTASAVQGQRQTCLAAGMNDFLTKPIDKEVFASALKRWIVNPLPAAS